MSKKLAILIAAILVLLVVPAQGQNRCQGDNLSTETSEPRPDGAYIERLTTQMAATTSWELICPPGCTKVTSPPNQHGQTKTFCDCDGDGGFDSGVCQIWLRNAAAYEEITPNSLQLPSGDFDPDYANLIAAGGQTPICAPGCAEEQQCSMITIDKPDGTTIKYCQCL